MGQHTCSITAGCSWCDTSRAIAKQRVKPYPKTERRLVTATIDEHGDVLFLASPENDVFLELGNVVTKRASHVEPAGFWLRQAFKFIRLFGDDTRFAAWTRRWGCGWRIDTRPVGGPILTWSDVAPSPCAPWMDTQTFTTHNRQEAIDAEIKFLNSWFLERGIKS